MSANSVAANDRNTWRVITHLLYGAPCHRGAGRYGRQCRTLIVTPVFFSSTIFRSVSKEHIIYLVEIPPVSSDDGSSIPRC
jgi:hypothetical protein